MSLDARVVVESKLFSPRLLPPPSPVQMQILRRIIRRSDKRKKVFRSNGDKFRRRWPPAVFTRRLEFMARSSLSRFFKQERAAIVIYGRSRPSPLARNMLRIMNAVRRSRLDERKL
jgi:hypothetical protein